MRISLLLLALLAFCWFGWRFVDQRIKREQVSGCTMTGYAVVWDGYWLSVLIEGMIHAECRFKEITVQRNGNELILHPLQHRWIAGKRRMWQGEQRAFSAWSVPLDLEPGDYFVTIEGHANWVFDRSFQLPQHAPITLGTTAKTTDLYGTVRSRFERNCTPAQRLWALAQDACDRGPLSRLSAKER